MLEATDIQIKNWRLKIEKLSVNKHLFCVKKEKFKYFLISSMIILKFRKCLIINQNESGFWIE